MEQLSNLLGGEWLNALGWTLIHSIWQSAILLAAALACIRLIGKNSSGFRYLTACAAMGLIVVSAAATYVYELEQRSQKNTVQLSASMQPRATASHPAWIMDDGLIAQIANAVESNMNWIVFFWLTGTLVFVLRLAGGWFYLRHLRSTAVGLDAHWQNVVARLAGQIELRVSVTVAESVRVTAPVVIGYLKPVILLPVGMIGGLSTVQIEAILVHELAHIKRHDFLVNVLQSIVEVIFFFNPLTWVMSDIIRREREYCCDDAVITTNYRRADYARALAKLEDARQSAPLLVMSLAGEKKHLLNRIRRIMENPLSNKTGNERLIPVALLVVGLACASWLSIGSDESVNNFISTTERDTLKDKKTSSDYRPWSSHDNKRTPLKPKTPPDVMPMIAMKFPSPVQPKAPFFYATADTVPFKMYFNDDVEKFTAEFQEAFKEKFGDFYEKNAKDFEKLMKEVQADVESQMEHDVWNSREWEESMAADLELTEEAMAAHEVALAEMNEQHGLQQHQLAQIEQELAVMQMASADQMAQLQIEVGQMERELAAFEEKLVTQLVKDGYLTKGEEVKNISWDDDGEIEVNGKKIREADKKKYHELHRKYFNGPGRFQHAE
jgi:bla regulator protein BlaR1